MPRYADGMGGKRLKGTTKTRDRHKFGEDGWAKCEDYKPVWFELVLLSDATGKTQRGWWTGTIWDFGARRIGDPVKWRNESEYVL